MSADVFVDTNVLVYARDTTETRKQPLALAWLDRLWRTRRGRTSVQVLNEYFVTVTVKLKPGLTADTAWDDVQALFVWKPVALDVALLAKAREIQKLASLTWWDAMIVAAAHRSGCTYLLSEDLQDGQNLDGVRILNPFTHRVDEILTDK